MVGKRIIIATLTVLAGCGLTSQVRPTPKGQLSIQGAIGGPAANVGVPVPLPMAAVGAGWGVHERADLSAHTHLPTLLAARFFGADVGVGWLVIPQDRWGPAVTLGVRGYAFTDFSTATLGFYELSGAASWDYGRYRPFVSFIAQLDAQALGAEIAFGRFTLIAELRWYAPGRNARVASVPWASMFGQGALGLVIGGRYDVLGAVPTAIAQRP